MANLVEETRNIMKKYGIRANKDLGQNFLINNEVVENIVNSSEISQDDMVIEIGPGLGTLTKYLLEKAGKVLCIELDRKMIEILEDRFEKYSNFEIINDDVLKVDLNKIIKENKENEKIKNDLQKLLIEYHDDGKDPNPMAKSMSWLKTNVKLAVNESDDVVADIITNGCNMGVKTLYRYLNQYKAADEKSKNLTKTLISLEEKLAANLRKFL